MVDELDPSQESVLFGVEPSQTLPANAMPDEDIMPSIETLISMITSVPIIRVDINKPFDITCENLMQRVMQRAY